MEFDPDFNKKDEQTSNNILQEIKGTLEGGIRSVNIGEFRNLSNIYCQDNLDDSYPLYVHFNITSEMVKIVSVKVSFWIRPYRGYCDNSGDESFGIYEEDNSPTIKFYVSENEGVSYNAVFFGGYTTKQTDVDITSLLSGSGNKLLKFESTARARLSVQVEIKLDIKAR